jgi:hypothetical protein
MDSRGWTQDELDAFRPACLVGPTATSAEGWAALRAHRSMKRKDKHTEGTMAEPPRLRGLRALMPGHAVAEKALPEDVRAELRRMSKSATELLLEHMDYDEARGVMRHGWPSRYFAHLSKVAKKAKL